MAAVDDLMKYQLSGATNPVTASQTTPRVAEAVNSYKSAVQAGGTGGTQQIQAPTGKQLLSAGSKAGLGTPDPPPPVWGPSGGQGGAPGVTNFAGPTPTVDQGGAGGAPLPSTPGPRATLGPSATPATVGLQYDTNAYINIARPESFTLGGNRNFVTTAANESQELARRGAQQQEGIAEAQMGLAGASAQTGASFGNYLSGAGGAMGDYGVNKAGQLSAQAQGTTMIGDSLYSQGNAAANRGDVQANWQQQNNALAQSGNAAANLYANGNRSTPTADFGQQNNALAQSTATGNQLSAAGNRSTPTANYAQQNQALAKSGTAADQLSQAGNRASPTANYGQQNQALGQSNSAVNQLLGVESTAGPSAAQAQLQAGLNAAEQSNMSLARSGRGWGGSASALAEAGRQNAVMGANTANNAAILRANEDAAARSRTAQNLTQAASLSQSAANQFGNQAQADVANALQARQLNDAAMAQGAGLNQAAAAQFGQQAQADVASALQSRQINDAALAQGASINQAAAAQYGNQAQSLVANELQSRQLNDAALASSGGLSQAAAAQYGQQAQSDVTNTLQSRQINDAASQNLYNAALEARQIGGQQDLAAGQLGLSGLQAGANTVAQGGQLALAGQGQAGQLANQAGQAYATAQSGQQNALTYTSQLAQAQLQASQAYEQARLQEYGIRKGVAIQSSANQAQMIGAGISALGSLAGGAAMLSDVRAKERIKPMSAVEALLSRDDSLLDMRTGEERDEQDDPYQLGYSRRGGVDRETSEMGSAEALERRGQTRGSSSYAGPNTDLMASHMKPKLSIDRNANTRKGIAKMADSLSAFANLGKGNQGQDFINRYVTSDEREKTDLRPARGYSYEYKDPERHGRGRFIGPMAQDLMKTPAGKAAVVRQPDGSLGVDTGRLSLTNTSAIGEQQRRADEQEERLTALERLLRHQPDERLAEGPSRPKGRGGLSFEAYDNIGVRSDAVPNLAMSQRVTPRDELRAAESARDALAFRHPTQAMREEQDVQRIAEKQGASQSRAFGRAALRSGVNTLTLPARGAAKFARALGSNHPLTQTLADDPGEQLTTELESLRNDEGLGDSRARARLDETAYPLTREAGEFAGDAVAGSAYSGLSKALRGGSMTGAPMARSHSGMLADESGEMRRLYRAADDDYISDTASFAVDKETARAYLDNPGFGGKNLYKTDVDIDPDDVLDIRDDLQEAQLARLVEESGMAHPGASTADREITQPEVYESLRRKGYKWVRLNDTYPEGAETWTYIGGPEHEPLLRELKKKPRGASE